MVHHKKSNNSIDSEKQKIKHQQKGKGISFLANVCTRNKLTSLYWYCAKTIYYIFLNSRLFLSESQKSYLNFDV